LLLHNTNRYHIIGTAFHLSGHNGIQCLRDLVQEYQSFRTSHDNTASDRGQAFELGFKLIVKLVHLLVERVLFILRRLVVWHFWSLALCIVRGLADLCSGQAQGDDGSALHCAIKSACHPEETGRVS
jgi:hypothetical protein